MNTIKFLEKISNDIDIELQLAVYSKTDRRALQNILECIEGQRKYLVKVERNKRNDREKRK